MGHLELFTLSKKFLRNKNFFPKQKFLWSDFKFTSTLQLSPFVELLLEPIGQIDNLEEVKLGLHEALVNAVRHGNSYDQKKVIRVRRIITPNWFIWQIQDEGKGIPKDARKYSLPEQLDANNGRGLFIIHSCFDDIRWSGRGNRLQLSSLR